MAEDAACAFCGAAQDLRRLAIYHLDVCSSCWSEAECGWPKPAEPVLFEALAAQGLLIPDRNEADLLPRDYAPPADFAL